MKNLLYLFILPVLLSCTTKKDDLPPPNILWVTIEDLSPMIGPYGDANANTPYLNAFAERSIKFTNAFASAPVCSPSRSCIITGFYASSLGTQHLRSQVAIPDSIKPYPKYLREAGYFTSNNSKEDYNFIDSTIWDQSSNKAHWRNRKGDQPFFSIFNLMLTHQSSIFGSDSVYEKRISSFLPFVTPTSPDNLKLPPYYPNTPETRKLWARYYTNVSIIDYQFAKIMEELEEDGLTENTVVFFYSDHGTGVPRHKRALYDSGMKIPFLVHIPEKYAGKFNFKPGTVDDNMITFIDMAPTLFALTGLSIPEAYPGKPIISSGQVPATSHIYGASDRVDEGFELARSIRTKQYLYIRNFLPHLPLLQPNWYTDNSEIMQELNRVRNGKNLTEAQKTMFAGNRAVEELYDVGKDPHQLHNLASDGSFREVLQELRQTLQEEILKNYDTAFAPEPELIRLAKGTTPYEFARDSINYPLKQILNVCDLMLDPALTIENLSPYLRHQNGLVRYWALIAARQMNGDKTQLQPHLARLVQDEMPTNQVEAAKMLAEQGNRKAVEVIIGHMHTGDSPLLLYASRAFQDLALRYNVPAEGASDLFHKLEIEMEDEENRKNFYRLYSYWALTYVYNKKTVA